MKEKEKVIEFFSKLEDPLNKKGTIDKLIKSYEESGYSSDYYPQGMYAIIVQTDCDDEVKDKDIIVCEKESEKFDLYRFNEWKKSILNYNLNNIKEAYMTSFIKLQNELKNYNPTTTKEINEFFFEKKDENYNTILKCFNYIKPDGGWDHVESGSIYSNGNNLNSDDVDHRFYIHLDIKVIHYFAKLFMEKCKDKKFNYYFKLPLDCSLDRSDSIVVYCDANNFLETLEILKEIKQEHPELNEYLRKPPFLTANIDEWIGYGAEPSVKYEEKKPYSYNTLRTKIINESITKLQKDWLRENKMNKIIENGEKIYFIDYIVEKIYNNKMEKVGESYKEWLKVMGETKAYSRFFENNEKFINEIWKNRDESFVDNYKKYIKNVIINIIDEIDYEQSDVDRFSINEDSHFKLLKKDIENVIREMVSITRYNIPNFDDKLIAEIYRRGANYKINNNIYTSPIGLSIGPNFAIDLVSLLKALKTAKNKDEEKALMTNQMDKSLKTKTKQFVYKPMTENEILNARRNIGY